MKNVEYESLIGSLAEYFDAGKKQVTDDNRNFKLGLEVEHFIMDAQGNSVMYEYESDKDCYYCGPHPGVKQIIAELKPLYDKCTYNTDEFGKKHLAGLTRYDATITIEPGAQFEVSLSAQSKIADIKKAYDKFVTEVKSVLDKYNYSLVYSGYRYDKCALEVPLIQSQRYTCMDAHFKNVGLLGPNMMRCSASTQVSIDYTSQEDCGKKLKIATCLAPIIYFLFDNSPVFERTLVVDMPGLDGTLAGDMPGLDGTLAGDSPELDCALVGDKSSQQTKTPSGLNLPANMARYCIWNDTDVARCRSMKSVFDNFTFESYAKDCADIPLIFCPGTVDIPNKNKLGVNMSTLLPVSYDGKYESDVEKLNEELTDAAKLNSQENEDTDLTDDTQVNPKPDTYFGSFTSKEITGNSALDKQTIEHVLSMGFCDARLKNFIELRAADCVPPNFIFAYVAFIKGLFYDKTALNKTWDIFSCVSYEQYLDAGESLYNNGWESEIYDENATDLIAEIFNIAKEGLAKADSSEVDYLRPIDKLIANKMQVKDCLSSNFEDENFDGFEASSVNCDESETATRNCNGSVLGSAKYGNEWMSKHYEKFASRDFSPVLSGTTKNTHNQVDTYMQLNSDLAGRKDYIKNLSESTITEHNEFVRTGYLAKIYDMSTVLQFSDIVWICSKILNKCCQKYLVNNDFAAGFMLDKNVDALIKIKQNYKNFTNIARYDIFYDQETGRFKICEFNSGGTSGMHVTTQRNNLAKKCSNPVKGIIEHKFDLGYDVETWDLFKPLIDVFESTYNEWLKNSATQGSREECATTLESPARGTQAHDVCEQNPQKPHIAIVDFLDKATINDFYAFEKHLNNAGFPTVICDVADLRYVNGKLKTKDGFEIDLVYKRATLDEFVKHLDMQGCKAFINAVKDKAVCSVDWFSTQVYHCKQISYMLHSELAKNIMTKDEIRFVELHVPKTALLDQTAIEKFHAITNKDKYIIKPAFGYASRDIIAGRDCTQQQWECALNKFKRCNDYGDKKADYQFKRCDDERNNKRCYDYEDKKADYQFKRCDNDERNNKLYDDEGATNVDDKEDFVIQEYADQYYSQNIAMDYYETYDSCKEDGADLVEDWADMTGLYVYGQNFNGVYLRIGKGSVNNDRYGNIECNVFYETPRRNH